MPDTFCIPSMKKKRWQRRGRCLWWGNQSIVQNSSSHSSYRVTTKCQDLCRQHERITINSTNRIFVLTQLGSPSKKPETFPSIELWVTEGRQRDFLRHGVGEGLSQAAPWEMLKCLHSTSLRKTPLSCQEEFSSIRNQWHIYCLFDISLSSSLFNTACFPEAYHACCMLWPCRSQTFGGIPFQPSKRCWELIRLWHC